MFEAISLFAAGLILFMFGMFKIGAKIQLLFTARIRQHIKHAVKKPVYGVITGVLATVLFQSSTTTTVLTVGMVSAGLVSFYHSLGIILGADIGTTFTVQLVVWKITAVSPVFIVLGGVLWFSGVEKVKATGEAILYFGLMLFGLSLTGSAVTPLKNNQTFIGFFQEARNPLWGVVLGAVFTAIVHASAIPISMLVVLAQQNLVTIETSLPIILGANIGTTITALMASLVGNVNGKRTAFSHFIFKSVGVAICLAGLPVFAGLLKKASESIAQEIALGHLLFNIFIAFVFIFLIKPVSRLIEMLIPGKGEMLPLWPVFLDPHCLANTEDALGCAQKELKRQLNIATRMYIQAIGLLSRYDKGTARDITYMELVEDNLRKEIVEYLCRISDQEFSPSMSERLFAYTAFVDDIERIGDHAVILRDLCEEMHLRKTEFTPWGKTEMEEITRLVEQNLNDALLVIEGADGGRINDIYGREELVDQKVKDAREKHLERFHRRICQAEAGPIFLEMLINLERISDHCQNIAEYMELLKKSA
ncbi:MAG: Na+/Pi-cotransporter [Syntrophorhabdaceae bacterium PtaU1.Bin034]|nr:MAG: Na+/Pi-cotransporter [Syntrophorhabdaceae bacterium PtaU1.Bin034]